MEMNNIDLSNRNIQFDISCDFNEYAMLFIDKRLDSAILEQMQLLQFPFDLRFAVYYLQYCKVGWINNFWAKK